MLYIIFIIYNMLIYILYIEFTNSVLLNAIIDVDALSVLCYMDANTDSGSVLTDCPAAS